MRKTRDCLGPLMSLGVGVLAGLFFTSNVNYGEEPQSVTINEPRPTLTPDQLIPSVSPTPEGDDGSLGGPVYDENHQNIPIYKYKGDNGQQHQRIHRIPRVHRPG